MFISLGDSNIESEKDRFSGEDSTSTADDDNSDGMDEFVPPPPPCCDVDDSDELLCLLILRGTETMCADDKLLIFKVSFELMKTSHDFYWICNWLVK